MARALWIIRDEHHRYGAVLDLVRHLLCAQGASERTIDIGLLILAFDYVAEFIATYHHPKEDKYLFPLTCLRAPEAATILDELARQHIEGDRMLTALRVRLEGLEHRPSADGFARFKRDAMAYIDFEGRHAMKETSEVLPIAERALTAADWAEIDAAFENNDDPVFGKSPRQKFERMISALANRAPAPFGYASASTPVTGARWPNS